MAAELPAVVQEMRSYDERGEYYALTLTVLLLLVRDASERLEAFYARLRRCRQLCSGRPFIEKHEIDDPHDCATEQCRAHVRKPYAASSIRQIHAILSGALSAAVRWGWIALHLAAVVRLSCDFLMTHDEGYPHGRSISRVRVVRPQVVWQQDLWEHDQTG